MDQSKKLKLPFPEVNFPAECLEDIFCHLNFNDLLKCTLVCPQWNDFIGSTKSCMGKIKFRCLNRFDNLKRIRKSLKESKRNYFCLVLEGDYNEEVQNILWLHERKWTLIYVRCANFENFDRMKTFLRAVESAVEYLLMIRITIESSKMCDGVQELKFP